MRVHLGALRTAFEDKSWPGDQVTVGQPTLLAVAQGEGGDRSDP